MAKLRYTGDPVWAPPEIVAANPGKDTILANGVEREVPDKLAKELLERDYWTKVTADKK